MKTKNKIKRAYRLLTGAPLANKSLAVSGKMNGNIKFIKPDVDPALMDTTAKDLIAATVKTEQGTMADTEHKHILEALVIGQMDTQANYVENIAQNDAETILSSGFELANLTHNASIVTGSSITAIANVASTKLGLTVVIDPEAWTYQVEISTVAGVWGHWENFTDPHNIVLAGLVPGQLYGIRIRVLGVGNQRSEWSESVSHMST